MFFASTAVPKTRSSFPLPLPPPPTLPTKSSHQVLVSLATSARFKAERSRGAGWGRPPQRGRRGTRRAEHGELRGEYGFGRRFADGARGREEGSTSEANGSMRAV